ncbi:DUF1127 domain-containing protein [Roseomonas sp. SSH11]|uniref:DUF1127 domain-containing protein n=1 Tax=Pararoseomonas baculiformis TaxID=2820812 RepID=A0ABS4AJJ3_9PROT|nr:DUF1127 domain-containing protein [Pararoseomonas baculiformis]MBP0447201.1 DUF1127 domain-containing protein [Pararoseomonas baculiformis]
MSGHVITRSALAREACSAARRVPARHGRAFGWFQGISHMLRVIEERRILATLDDRMLSDVGLNRLEVEREIARAPWDLDRRG